MNELEEKGRMILAQERLFADILASRALSKPKPNVWMILIPIIFVFYMNDYKKYKDGRQVFADQYLMSRKRALDEAVASLTANRDPDLEPLVSVSDLPEAARQQYHDLLTVLIENYRDLLQTEGETVNDLVRAAYANKTNYLLFLNRLNRAEKELNAALRPVLDDTDKEMGDVIMTIERSSEELRRSKAEEIFS
jgi:hypothetical protein